jgi:hypothetical protein
VSEPYEDIGHTEAWKPAPAKAMEPNALRRHKWKFLHHFDKATKHHCVRCGVTRVVISHADRFPSTRYTTLAGAVNEGKAPPCNP